MAGIVTILWPVTVSNGWARTFPIGWTGTEYTERVRTVFSRWSGMCPTFERLMCPELGRDCYHSVELESAHWVAGSCENRAGGDDAYRVGGDCANPGG